MNQSALGSGALLPPASAGHEERPVSKGMNGKKASRKKPAETLLEKRARRPGSLPQLTDAAHRGLGG